MATSQPYVDEKHAEGLLATPQRPEKRPFRHVLLGKFLPAALLTLSLLLLFRSTFISHGRYDPAKGFLEDPVSETVEDAFSETNKISLEAHIMSKCPDARDCLQQLVVPTMERVSDKVDFKLSYIGKYG